MSASACYMIASMTSWPQTQVTNFTIDLMVTILIYQQVKPNFSIKLLVTASFLRWMFVVPGFLISTSYTPSSTEAFCDCIVTFADIGWFFNDQISLVSTAHRALSFTNDKKEQKCLKVLAGMSLVFGAFFRLFRNPCRYQYPNGESACWAGTGAIWDNLTVVNVILFEMLLLGFLIYKIHEFVKNKMDATGMLKKFYTETVLRFVVLVPLGVCETLAYIIQQTPGAPTWLNWVLTVAIYCRQFNPLIISVVIVSGNLTYNKSSNTKGRKLPSSGQTNIKTKEKEMDE
ncbi:hypothetical protein HK103_006649 [Boothiomyces macroporosus]|uniref:Uncharacterized protein n=1 Tax=Boothiomyces macroporosus TaxID=261099 RepID=A0AAD5UGM4_9FUNG|nr:hypothetical protein HK103_006649 [Boothiomyces macroporosus]